MVFAEVAVEVDIVDLHLRGELVLLRDSHFLAVRLPAVLLHALDRLVQLVLEHLDGRDWVLDDVAGQAWVVMPQLVHVHIQSVLSTYYIPYSLIIFLVV